VLDGFSGLLEQRFRHLGPPDVRNLISTGGTVLGTTNRDNPFSFPGDGGPVDRSQEAVENAHKAGIEALVVIGGDGTLNIASELGRLGLNVVGVPKTIDNDLPATDYTFGFWTAIGTATEALDRLRDTGESHHRVMVLEVMGRNAGWIALHTGVAGAADVILIPEIPYSAEVVAGAVRKSEGRGKLSSLIVVAEGAVPRGGSPAVRRFDPVTGYPLLGGAGARLVHELEQLTHCDIRCTVLGHLQRGGSPIAFDRILATRLGDRAAHLVGEKRYGRMVRLSHGHVDDIDLSDAVGGIRQVEPANELVRTARSQGITFGDEA
jgi:6-phosphofructokinase 1